MQVKRICSMLPWSIEHILSTCIEIPNGFQAYVLSIFEWPLKTGFTLVHLRHAFSECIENPIEKHFSPVKMCTVCNGSNGLTLNAPIATKVVCFTRLLKCLRSLYDKQCGPSSDCSYRSSLFWVHTVCFYS